MTTTPSKNRSVTPLILVITTVIAIIGVVTVYTFTTRNTYHSPPHNTSSPTVLSPTSVAAATFAAYQPTPVSITPKIPAYSAKEDLSNIINIADFNELSTNARKLLIKNQFIVTPGYDSEFYTLYERNRYGFAPSFITTDSMLHNYHLMFDDLLKKLEEQKLSSELKKLSANMLADSLAQYDSLKGTPWENAAKRNVGFFAVGSKLIDPNTKIPNIVQTEVTKELSLIDAHQAIEVSPVMNLGESTDPITALKEDYSQYIPRGHYNKTDQLKAYFKTMMWYGRLTFRLKSDDEIRSGILITLALNKDINQTGWNAIYEPTNFFVGKSDDITYYQFKDLLTKTYGANTTISTIINQNKFNSFIDLAQKLAPPQINSIPILQASIQPDRDKEIKGFRFMGQRFTVDANIFQNLVERSVTDRYLPKGLDIPAAFGSDEAYTILNTLGETKYKNYNDNLQTMKSYVTKLPSENWTQNLYWGWLYSLRPLLTAKPTGYPSFMTNNAWTKKDLHTFLGSWTELKHDTILYTAQTYAEMGGGGPEEKDDRGYVEPNVDVYARLTSLIKMMREGLEQRSLLTNKMSENLKIMEQLSLSLKTISEKELNNQKLTNDEYELIRSYGGQLEHLWLTVNQEELNASGTTQNDYLIKNPAALIADVATDPNGQVLEEATGFINPIYVVVPIDGKLRIAKGGVYSYYEFAHNLSDRLTDQKWREILQTGDIPAVPTWTNDFLVKNLP